MSEYVEIVVKIDAKELFDLYNMAKAYHGACKPNEPDPLHSCSDPNSQCDNDCMVWHYWSTDGEILAKFAEKLNSLG